GCRLLDIARGAELRRVALRASVAEPTTMAVSPGGRLVAVAEQDHVYLFDPTSGKERVRFKVPGLVLSLRLGVSHDPDRIAGGDAVSGVIRVRDPAAGKGVAELKGEWNGRLARLTFSPDGRTLAAIIPRPGAGGAAVVWDVATGKERY